MFTPKFKKAKEINGDLKVSKESIEEFINHEIARYKHIKRFEFDWYTEGFGSKQFEGHIKLLDDDRTIHIASVYHGANDSKNEGIITIYDKRYEKLGERIAHSMRASLVDYTILKPYTTNNTHYAPEKMPKKH